MEKVEDLRQETCARHGPKARFRGRPEPLHGVRGTAPMIRVFISYRRDDSLLQTGRLYDRLVSHFGREQVFRDVDAIPLGLDFREVLTEQVARCDVFLAVIGDAWLSIQGERGTRRLDDPADFVRIEIEAALSRDIPVIPVLVGHSSVPRAAELPASLRALSFRHALPVRPDPDFHKDMDRLIRGIGKGIAARRERSRWPLIVAAAMIGCLLLGLIIYVETDKGRIRIVPDPMPVPKRIGPPAREITNSIGMKLVLIPAGEFMMGSDETDPDAEDDEVVVDAAGKKQKHRVRITRPFYLGATEVTRGQFRRFVDDTGYRTEAEKDGKGGYGLNEAAGKIEQDPNYTWQNLGFEQTDEHPVLNVSWNDAVAFCEWLRKKEGVTYRQPTEAEWEYACRAGTTTRYSCGDDPGGLSAVGNFSGRGTVLVRRYNPNAWGLFDMHGNVWEWCSDGYAPDYYRRSPTDDPQGAERAPRRVLRGGGWSSEPRLAQSAIRGRYAPGFRDSGLGFRLAREHSVR
jgi:formylglycine-generating enzyme required for sulfatase activity